MVTDNICIYLTRDQLCGNSQIIQMSKKNSVQECSCVKQTPNPMRLRDQFYLLTLHLLTYVQPVSLMHMWSTELVINTAEFNEIDDLIFILPVPLQLPHFQS